MKHMWKKNQIIITALAALVAVAGYLNYSGTKLGENALPASTTETEATLTDIDSLDQDITLTDSADGEVYLGEAAAGETDGMSDASLSASETDAGTDTASEEVTDTPGEAVLTSTGTGSSFAAQAKLTREQVRSKNKETLLEIINNENVTEEQKQNAVNDMTALTENAEKEAAAELLLEAKGFKNVVVNLTGETADVVIPEAELSDAQRAQIEDIVKRKTGIAPENIVITPLKESEDAEDTTQTDETSADTSYEEDSETSAQPYEDTAIDTTDIYD